VSHGLGVKSTLSLCALEKNYFYVNFAHFRKCISVGALWMRSIAECLELRTVNADATTVLGSIPVSSEWNREAADQAALKNILKKQLTFS
jgi:hypothetical protein